MIVRVGVERAIICIINRRQRVWHGDLVPFVSESRIIGKRPSGRPRAGMLDRVKNDFRSGQEAHIISVTIRKDLPVGRTHTQ